MGWDGRGKMRHMKTSKTRPVIAKLTPEEHAVLVRDCASSRRTLGQELASKAFQGGHRADQWRIKNPT